MPHRCGSKKYLIDNDRITDDRKGCNIFERHKIISSLILAIFAVTSVFALIGIKYHGYTKSDNFVPSSGEWKGHAYSNTTKYPFQIQLNFLSNSTFTGSVYFGSTGF